MIGAISSAIAGGGSGWASSSGWLRRLTPLPLVSLSLLLVSCGRITIATSVKDQGVSPPRQLSSAALRRGDQPSPRALEIEPRPETESIRKARFGLAVDVQGQPNDLGETYRYLHHTQDDWQFFAGTSEDRSFVINRYGGLVSLAAARGSGPQSFQRNVGTHVGTGYLFVIQNHDRVVPWELRPPRAGALDIKALSKLIFEQISDSTRRSVEGVFHDSLSFVPRIRNAKIEAAGGRARGFGFIYRVTVQRPLVSVDVYVPINFVFRPLWFRGFG